MSVDARDWRWCTLGLLTEDGVSHRIVRVHSAQNVEVFSDVCSTRAQCVETCFSVECGEAKEVGISGRG